MNIVFRKNLETNRENTIWQSSTDLWPGADPDKDPGDQPAS